MIEKVNGNWKFCCRRFYYSFKIRYKIRVQSWSSCYTSSVWITGFVHGTKKLQNDHGFSSLIWHLWHAPQGCKSLDLKRCKTFGGICRIYPSCLYHAQFRDHLGRFAATINKSGLSFKRKNHCIKNNDVVIPRPLVAVLEFWISLQIQIRNKIIIGSRMMAAQLWDHPGLCCRDRHLLSAWLPLSTWANTNTSKGELQIRSMEKYKYGPLANTNTSTG